MCRFIMSIDNNKKMNKKKFREFKNCTICNGYLKWDKCRERKNLGLKNINKKLRSSHCKKCEANVANLKYRKNPTPQYMYNLKKKS